MVRKLLVPAGEKVVGALNPDHIIAVEGVEQVLLRAEAFLRKGCEALDPGLPRRRGPTEDSGVEALKSGVGALNFVSNHQGCTGRRTGDGAKYVVPSRSHHRVDVQPEVRLRQSVSDHKLRESGDGEVTPFRK